MSSSRMQHAQYTCMCTCVYIHGGTWTDTFGTEESVFMREDVLVSGVIKCIHRVFGTAKCDRFKVCLLKYPHFSASRLERFH